MRGSWRWPVWVLIGLALLGVANGATKGESTAHIVGASLLLAVLALATFPPRLWELITAIPRPKRKAVQQQVVGDPLQAVRDRCWRAGGGVYLGLTTGGDARFARSERAVLLLGPPRSGKTSGVMVPAIIAHTGPVVSASTKDDVMRATRLPRAMSGKLWVFDPTGNTPASPGASSSAGRRSLRRCRGMGRC